MNWACISCPLFYTDLKSEVSSKRFHMSGKIRWVSEFRPIGRKIIFYEDF